MSDRMQGIMSKNMICQKTCQKQCQNICQKKSQQIWQKMSDNLPKKCRKKSEDTPEDMPGKNVTVQDTPERTFAEMSKEWYTICQMECRRKCQNECQIDPHKMSGTSARMSKVHELCYPTRGQAPGAQTSSLARQNTRKETKTREGKKIQRSNL